AAPLGWLVARTDMPLARTVRTLVMASLVTPPFVRAGAWGVVAGPHSAPPHPSPYVFIRVANALPRMPGELEDASSMLGARMWATARRITIPLALPTILAGALVAFLQALNLFG